MATGFVVAWWGGAVSWELRPSRSYICIICILLLNPQTRRHFLILWCTVCDTKVRILYFGFTDSRSGESTFIYYQIHLSFCPEMCYIHRRDYEFLYLCKIECLWIGFFWDYFLYLIYSLFMLTKYSICSIEEMRFDFGSRRIGFHIFAPLYADLIPCFKVRIHISIFEKVLDSKILYFYSRVNTIY